MYPKFDLSTLNPPQRSAVTHTEGALLVLAGAGSGKTRVIIHRIAYLLAEQRVNPQNILAVTFTNKAAEEMRERAAELVGSAAKDLLIATFHSLCVRILRREIEALGFRKNFAIYSTGDQVGVVKQVMRDMGLDAKRHDPDSVLWAISGAKNRLLSPAEFVPRSDTIETVAAAVYPKYQSALKACNAVDFDDIIMLTVDLFRRFPEVTARWQERFRYIMVDEYQDTNPSQYLLVRQLASRWKNICVVGDDDQSIYGWRGAEVANILNFEKDWSGCRTVRLEQNYRSTGHILNAANAVIRNNSVRKEKTLWTDGGDGAPIELLVAEDDEDEASTVVERIQAEIFKKDLAFRDFAILYRTNAQSRSFEEQLRFESIPYVLVGGFRFFDRKEVKDSIAYLRVLDNPADEQALYRIMNFPRRGIGETTVGKVNTWSLENGKSLFESLGRVEEIAGISDAARLKILEFHRFLLDWTEKFRGSRAISRLVGELFDTLKLEDELFRTTDDPQTARRKVENLEQVVNSVAAYEARHTGGLSDFLEKISLMDEDRFDGKKKKGQETDAVTLMSLHASKGLEFPHVFLVGMEEEILPHGRTLAGDGSLEEERRLCYVGITRARKQLTISRCSFRRKYGKLEERTPSRFLQEIPEGVVSSGPAEPAGEEEQAQMAKNFFSRMNGMFD